jgi:hypothetical protein
MALSEDCTMHEIPKIVPNVFRSLWHIHTQPAIDHQANVNKDENQTTEHRAVSAPTSALKHFKTRNREQFSTIQHT